jgi:hypothetical protein
MHKLVLHLKVVCKFAVSLRGISLCIEEFNWQLFAAKSHKFNGSFVFIAHQYAQQEWKIEFTDTLFVLMG